MHGCAAGLGRRGLGWTPRPSSSQAGSWRSGLDREAVLSSAPTVGPSWSEHSLQPQEPERGPV